MWKDFLRCYYNMIVIDHFLSMINMIYKQHGKISLFVTSMKFGNLMDTFWSNIWTIYLRLLYLWYNWLRSIFFQKLLFTFFFRWHKQFKLVIYILHYSMSYLYRYNCIKNLVNLWCELLKKILIAGQKFNYLYNKRIFLHWLLKTFLFLIWKI